MKVIDSFDEVFERAAQTVEPPHHDGVAGSEQIHEMYELGPLAGPRGRLHKDSTTASFAQLVDLELRVLIAR